MRVINKVIYKNLFGNFWPLFFVVCLTLLIVAVEALLPWPFKILIDNVLSSSPDGVSSSAILGTFFHSRYTLGLFAVAVYFFSMLFSSLLEYAQAISTKRIIKKMTASIAKEAFSNMETFAIGYYDKKQIGDYIYRLGYDTPALGSFLEEGIIPLVTACLHFLVTVTIMLLINVNLAIIALIIVPFLTTGLYFFNKHIRRAAKRSEIINSSIFSFIEEALTHLKVIQAFSKQQKESHDFDKKINISLKSDMRTYILDFSLALFIGVVIAFSYSTIMLYGIHAVFFGTLTAGLLIVFIFYLDNLTSPLLSIVYATTSMSESYVKLARMGDFFDPHRHVVHSGSNKVMTNTSMKFENVTVVGDDNIKILDNVSFTIEQGKFTVIFGLNGSGKTTIVNLFLRFIDKIQSGRILIGGTDIQGYDLKFLRDTIAFVPQEVSLFDDTVKNNIAFGTHGASLYDVKQAAKLARADNFINKLPTGYDFNVGEGGIFLSGGQRQRIMLARALIRKDAKILLLDETVSSLDVSTRRDVIDSIAELVPSKTIVAVSNVFDVIKAADNVIVMNNGKVIYSGSSSGLSHEATLYEMIVDSNLE